MTKLIEPRTLKGFRDYPPALMIPREHLLEQTRRVYRSYGFVPIDTPALEYTEILLGKMAEESEVRKIIYRFQDHGDRDVALRFDLTVPFARFASQYIGQIGTPFKRYQMGPVWRGENTGHGRYREFWQCDFDTIGTTSNAADIEVALVIHDLMTALGFKRFRIHVNNRLVLNGLLEELGLAGKTEALLRALDKLGKAGRDPVIEEMISSAAATREQAERVLALAEMQGDNGEILERLRGDFGRNAKAADGIGRLQELVDSIHSAGVNDEKIVIDLSIARGLDYYTGSVYETFLLDLPQIGSVCSGGRYDDLAGLFTKQKLPGVGASLGLDRLLSAMEELQMVKRDATTAQVLVLQFSTDRIGEYQRMGRALRAAGIGCEVFVDPKKVGQQLQYAERRGFKIALIAGPDEFAQKSWKVKNLALREETTVPEAEVISFILSRVKEETQ
jgi:histidyl-tRNA synthetase